MRLRELAPRPAVIPIVPVVAELVQGGDELHARDAVNAALPKDDPYVVEKGDTGIHVRAAGLELQRSGSRFLAGTKAVGNAEERTPIVGGAERKAGHVRLRIKLHRPRPLREQAARLS